MKRNLALFMFFAAAAPMLAEEPSLTVYNQNFAIVREKLNAPDFVTQKHKDWDKSRAWFAKTFASQPRDHWVAVFEGTDACVGPVLTIDELAAHPHHAARGSFLDSGPAPAAAPAPRFSRTPGAPQQTSDGEALMRVWRTRE